MIRTQNSPLAAVLLNPEPGAVRCLLDRLCPPDSASLASLFRKLVVSTRAVIASDIFVANLSNPSGLLPEAPSHLLADMASRLRSVLEDSERRAEQHQQNELEGKLDSLEIRNRELERDILDLESARTQLAEQLSKKKEALELRVMASGAVKIKNWLYH